MPQFGSCSVAQATLAIVTTSPYQVALFLRAHLDALPADLPWLIFTNTEDAYRGLVPDLDLRHIPIERTQHLTRSDLISGAVLHRQLRLARVRTVVTLSPKAGFVGQLAAKSAGVRNRLHIFTGQVWDDVPPGPKRLAVRSADRVIARAATHLAADSPSQALRLKQGGIVPGRKGVSVPHPAGSIRGVDLTVFRPRPDTRSALREEYGLGDDTVAFVQLGRLARAKGVVELVEAFGHLRTAWTNGGLLREPRLYLVGQEDEDGVLRELLRDGIEVIPFTTRPERVLAAMDVLVLASHREGFGSTIIEAAAMGLPAIGTDIVGIRDAIIPGETGWLVPPMSSESLYAAMAYTLQNPSETQARGTAAFTRVQRDFDSATVTRAWADYLMAVNGGCQHGE